MNKDSTLTFILIIGSGLLFLSYMKLRKDYTKEIEQKMYFYNKTV